MFAATSPGVRGGDFIGPGGRSGVWGDPGPVRPGDRACCRFGLGAASGVLGVAAYRFRWAWLGWLTLAQLAAAVYLYSPLLAAWPGACAGCC